MRRIIPVLAAVFLAVFFSRLHGGVFDVPDYGVALEVPAGWQHDADDTFGFVLCDPQATKKLPKIRIHYPGGNAKSPEEQARRSLENINKRRAGRFAVEEVRREQPVVTQSGLHGYLSAHGFSSEGMRPYINHYNFLMPNGRILCVCLYLMGSDEATERRLEEILLRSLTLR